ncbi:hypothetical protein ACR42D_01975 [Desulfovibrio caledoniensis]
MIRRGPLFSTALPAAFLALGLLLAAACPALADGATFLRALSGLGDRSPGSPGLAKAADMVENEFRRLFPDGTVGRQSFHLPVQVQEGATLTMAATGRVEPLRQLRANALSPGAVAPPGIDGPLLYAAGGRVVDFDGMAVQGSVVLMDMDSGKNWNNAAMLGARGLIFVGAAATAARGPGPVSETSSSSRRWISRSSGSPANGPRPCSATG